MRATRLPQASNLTAAVVHRRVANHSASRHLSMEGKLKVILCSLATIIVLGLGTGLVVKVLSLGSSSSHNKYKVEPNSNVHRSNTKVFDFSNTMITGSTILGVLALMLALSYVFKKRIIKRLSLQLSAPAAPVGFNVATGFPQLPQFAPGLTQPTPAIASPSYQPHPLGKIPSVDKLARTRYGLYSSPPVYVPRYLERPNLATTTEAEDMETKMRELELNARITTNA